LQNLSRASLSWFSPNPGLSVPKQSKLKDFSIPQDIFPDLYIMATTTTYDDEKLDAKGTYAQAGDSEEDITSFTELIAEGRYIAFFDPAKRETSNRLIAMF
jgi:hypothetical protein